MSFSQAVSQLFEFSKLTAHMASSLGVEESAVLEAINSFDFPAGKSAKKEEAKPVKTTSKKTEKPATKTTKTTKSTKKTEVEDDEDSAEVSTSKPATKTTTKKTKTEAHTCAFLLTKVRSGEPCGKSATHQHNDQWYCGTHFKTVSSADEPATKTTKSTKKTTAKKVGQSPVENKPVLKAMEERELQLKKNKWGNLWDAHTHIVLKKKDDGNFIVIGQQNMDAKVGDKSTVLALDGQLLGICQGWNLDIDESAMPSEDENEETTEENNAEEKVEDDEELEVEDDDEEDEE